MDDQKPMPLARSRTYARDLEQARKKNGLAPSANLPTSPVPQVPIATPPQPPIAKDVPTPPTSRPATPERAEMINVNADMEDDTVISQAVHQTRADEEEAARDTTTTTIPSLHSLKNDVAAITKKDARLENIIIEDDESGATIITDTKTDRFHITTSIFSSLKTWWANKQRERREKKIPKYVVPDTERRKGIIQMATSQTARGATSDSRNIRDQVLRRNNTPIAVPPATTWTPNTETVWPLLEAPEEEGIVEPIVQNIVATPRTTTVETAPPIPLPPEPEPITVTAPEIITPVVAQEADTRWSTALLEELENTPEVVPPPSLPDQIKEEVEAPLPDPVTATPRKQFRVPSTTTLTLSVVVIAIVVLAVVGSMRYFSYSQEMVTSEQLGTSILLRIPTITISATTTTKTEVLGAITSLKNSHPSTKEVFFATSSAGHTPVALLSLIDPTIDPNLSQSVTTMVFGWQEKSDAFIVLRITDRTTALGGMLKSENSLKNALTELFAIPIDKNATFIDRTIAGTDVRTFTHSDGSIHFVYGFVNDNTLIITTNLATFSALSTLVTPRE